MLFHQANSHQQNIRAEEEQLVSGDMRLEKIGNTRLRPFSKTKLSSAIVLSNELIRYTRDRDFVGIKNDNATLINCTQMW